MSTLTSIEKRQVEEAFGMEAGYVLDFKNRDFGIAVKDATGKDIGETRYSVEGVSKAKRLRSFWTQESDQVVGSLIRSLVEYAEIFHLMESGKLEACRRIAARLDGKGAKAEELTAWQFLDRDYPDVRFDRVPIEGGFIFVMEHRWSESKACFEAGAYLSVVLLLGSMLEGLLLGTAQATPQKFNQAPSAPKDEAGKVLPFWRWNLASMIDSAYEVGALRLDVKKFSHALRDFRNYIHPYEQKASGFVPDQDTARVCLHVFRAAVNQLSKMPQ